MARTALFLPLVLALLAGCKDPPRSPAARKRPTPAAAPGPTILDPRFAFTCSAERVGCDGVFPVRPPDGERPSEAAVLQGGEEALRLRMKTLQRAKRSIRIQALIFRGDEAGQLIARHLKKKRAEGVEVRVIVDALSNLDWQTQWLYFDLKKHGVEVEGYEALYLQWITAEQRPDDPLRPNKRFHEKLWIVDAEDPGSAIAIVGGLNIANEYFRLGTLPSERWHDQDVALRGRIVDDVTRAFDRNYAFFKGLKARLPALFNPDNAWRIARRHRALIRKVRTPNWGRKSADDRLAVVFSKPCAPVFSRVRARLVQSRPRVGETYIEQAYADLVARAKRRIVIVNAYFIPSRAFTEKLRQAAARGVRVVVLTNSPESNDIHSVALVSRHTYANLLASPGIEIHEWQGRPFNEGTLHAKFAVFDSEVAIVGSFNLDPRSARLNSESAVVLQDAKLAGELERQVLERDLPRARRISLAEARTFRAPKDLAARFQLLFSLPLRDWL